MTKLSLKKKSVVVRHPGPWYRLFLSNAHTAFSGSGFNQLSLNAIKTQLDRFITLTASLAAEANSTDELAIKWFGRLQFQLEHALSDLQRIVPWLGLLPVPVVFEELASLDTIPCHSSVKRIMESHLQMVETIEKKYAQLGKEKIWKKVK